MSFYEQDCPFCNLGTMVKTEIVTVLEGVGTPLGPSFDVVAFEPLAPVTPGHLLVVPTIHVPDVGWDTHVTGMVMQGACILAHWMNSCNVITSKGKAATQSVGHLHVHVVPRRHGDGLALPWTNQKETP